MGLTFLLCRKYKRKKELNISNKSDKPGAATQLPNDQTAQVQSNTEIDEGSYLHTTAIMCVNQDWKKPVIDTIETQGKHCQECTSQPMDQQVATAPNARPNVYEEINERGMAFVIEPQQLQKDLYESVC